MERKSRAIGSCAQKTKLSAKGLQVGERQPNSITDGPRPLDMSLSFTNTAPLMAGPKANELMEKIVSLCKRRGFIFQSSEIYGGINGFWDYGPLGAELKRNVKELWWRSMTQERDDVVGLEASIIMHPKIWEASGHVNTFADPMCDCLVTGKRFRADQVEPQSGCVLRFAGAVDLVSIQKLAAEAKSPERSAIWSRTDLAPKLRILTENSSMAFGERYHGGCIMLCGSLEEQMEALK